MHGTTGGVVNHDVISLALDPPRAQRQDGEGMGGANVPDLGGGPGCVHEEEGAEAGEGGKPMRKEPAKGR